MRANAGERSVHRPLRFARLISAVCPLGVCELLRGAVRHLQNELDAPATQLKRNAALSLGIAMHGLRRTEASQRALNLGTVLVRNHLGLHSVAHHSVASFGLNSRHAGEFGLMSMPFPWVHSSCIKRHFRKYRRPKALVCDHTYLPNRWGRERFAQ
jgi:hypothetical protein